MGFQAHILAYHSQNIGYPRPDSNDHDALADDLEALHAAGHTIVALDQVLDALEGRGTLPEKSVCLTFDDGCDADYRDIDHPTAGPQRGFLGILQDFRDRHGPTAQSALHATSFVIASPEARRVIDQSALYGLGWLSDDWWAQADATGLLAIENHSWDHYHPALSGPGGGGDIAAATDPAACEEQLHRAADFIADRIGRRPRYFAYPFGETIGWLRDHYFTAGPAAHGYRAALGTNAGPVHGTANRWELPRLVCGREWKSPGELLQKLDA